MVQYWLILDGLRGLREGTRPTATTAGRLIAANHRNTPFSDSQRPLAACTGNHSSTSQQGSTVRKG